MPSAGNAGSHAQLVEPAPVDTCAAPADKPHLRLWAQQRRAEIDWAALSETLTERVASLPEMKAARNILLYLAMRNEVSVERLIEARGESTRRWYAPRCAPGRRLAVHRYLPGETALRRGPFGIREPDPEREPEIAPFPLDLVLVPALLLSEQGDRLGYGGGYYDRFLPTLAPGCKRVAALPDALVLPHLPRDPWDQRLDVLVTETRVLRFEGKSAA